MTKQEAIKRLKSTIENGDSIVIQHDQLDGSIEVDWELNDDYFFYDSDRVLGVQEDDGNVCIYYKGGLEVYL